MVWLVALSTFGLTPNSSDPLRAWPSRYALGVAKKTSSKASTPPDASHRVVVLCGKEVFLRSEYTNHLRDKLEAEHGQIDVLRFDGENAQISEILDECRSFGLMAAHKLVVVENADKLLNESTRPLLQRYAEAPSEGATLVLRASTWRKGNLDKAIAAVGVITPCDQASEARAQRWCVRRCEKQHNAKISPQVAALLIERTGPDLGRIDTELGKLSLAAGEGGEITPEIVGELVGRTREEEVWSIQSELLTGDAERTVGHLRAILDNAPRDAHVPVTFACTDLARKLHGASRAIAAGANPFQVGKDLKLWGPSRDAILGVGKRIRPETARALLEDCVAADKASKSGLGRPERTLERLALRFASVASGRA